MKLYKRKPISDAELLAILERAAFDLGPSELGLTMEVLSPLAVLAQLRGIEMDELPDGSVIFRHRYQGGFVMREPYLSIGVEANDQVRIDGEPAELRARFEDLARERGLIQKENP